MKPRRIRGPLIAALLATAAIAGYQPGWHPPASGIAGAAERALLYYQDPSGKPDYSPTPRKSSAALVTDMPGTLTGIYRGP